MKERITLLVLLLPLLQAVAQVPEASSVMMKSRDLSVAGSLMATVSLTITEKNGAERNRSISIITKSFADGQEKRLIKFLEPADVRGTAMLIIDNKSSSDEMWIYLPALKKTRRIVTSEKGRSFMSSEFSNADMTSPPVSDFTYKHLASSGADNTWIIESIPLNEEKADEYGYSGRISWISADKYQVQKMEFYNFDNELFKTIEIKSFFPLAGGKYMIKNMVAINLKNGRKSEILFTNIKEGAAVEDSNFTVQNLEK